MAVLFIFLSEYYSDFIVQREIDKHETVINEIKSGLQEKHEFVYQGIRHLYKEKSLIEDLAFALQHDYQDYISYRLDKFSSSESFVPYNFDIYVKNYFSRDPNVVALEIINETLGTEYVYLFKHGQFYESKIKRTEPSNLDNVNEQSDFYVVQEQINDPISLERLGTVSVYFTYEDIKEILSHSEEVVRGSFLITDENKNVFYSYRALTKEIFDELEYSTTQKQVKLKETYYIQSSIEPISKLMITSVIPKKELASLFKYKRTILSIILFLTFIAIALPYFSLRGYSKRVDQIILKMREVQGGDLSSRIDKTSRNDDLSVISETFNETLDELNSYINEVYFSQLKQKEAELANLQAQINPHFLYNTLEAIRMKSLSEGGRTTAKMIVQLSQLFRHSLNTAELVTIENEQNHAHQYIELFKNRFPGQLSSDIKVKESLRHYYVPPFILQPLIENYLIHGFKQQSIENELQITIYDKESVLFIEIVDNGKGIEKEVLMKIKNRLKNGEGSSNSIGLANVNQRIQLKYGGDFGVEIKSNPDVETVVTVRLPLISEVQLHDKSNVSRR
jgi:two-component system sensor histidine kinase YesM